MFHGLFLLQLIGVDIDMKEPNLEENIDKLLNEESAQAKAVSSLIYVKKKVKGELGSDIELKTDLTEKECCIHTGVDMLQHFLAMTPTEFISAPILQNLTTLKERKLLSKDRKSRGEIVDVARNPDMNTIMQPESGGI